MKTRTGFVSNSSSSSFIVAFPHKPKSAKELLKMMFDHEIFFVSDDDWYGDKEKKPREDDVVERVFQDLKGKKPAKEKNIAEALYSGSPMIRELEFPPKGIDWEETRNMPVEERKMYWEKEEEETKAWSVRIAKAFMSMHEGSTFFIFNYSDNDGAFESVLEHQDIFRNLPHIRVSQH